MRALAVAGLTLTLLATTGSTAATADPTPLDPLVDAGLLDPVIEVLPPRPVPHTPYTGQTCPDGSPACLDATIERMRAELDRLAAACDHDAVFALAYLRVTEDVRTAVAAGHFDDEVWLGQLDAVFARDYFEAMGDWHAGRTAEVPPAWRIALAAADEKAVTGLGNFLLAMNAHINRDFSYALAEVGLTAADGTSHKADHNAYNSRLDDLYAPVFAEEAARFDPTFDDVDVGPVEELAAGVIMRGWREMVWRNAESLVLARTPLQRLLAERTIEEYAATQALLIRRLFASPSPAARDAWCAGHGTG